MTAPCLAATVARVSITTLVGAAAMANAGCGMKSFEITFCTTSGGTGATAIVGPEGRPAGADSMGPGKERIST
jgi:hypothetical protein